MGGGLMQLVAYGAQDMYLTGNPTITFFKVVYRRYTNFAIESIEQTFNGRATFGQTNVTCQISRNGDLIWKTYVQATLPEVTLASTDGSGAQFRWLNWPGHNLIHKVKLEVGGQKIDEQWGDWMHIWNELTLPTGKQRGYARMVGNVPELVNLLEQGGVACDTTCSVNGNDAPETVSAVRKCAPAYTLYIPLEFFYCRNPGLALPLIALQYHEVKILVDFNTIENLCWYNNSAIRDRVATAGLQACSLFVDYIYLDTDERRKFAQHSHEYLIEQLQYSAEESITATSNQIRMNFNHPVKFLAWVVQRDDFKGCSGNDATVNAYKGRQPFNYTDFWDRAVHDSGYSHTLVEGAAGNNPVVSALIKLNGHDRFQERAGNYFNWVQPYQHFSNVPAQGINVYSFALAPEDHQPSGTCNFSRIDNATLSLTVTPRAVSCGSCTSAKVRIYAVNYNVFRVISGMGGLAYSN
jgi:hypothetical protein